jgi:hypothetical protein
MSKAFRPGDIVIYKVADLSIQAKVVKDDDGRWIRSDGTTMIRIAWKDAEHYVPEESLINLTR